MSVCVKGMYLPPSCYFCPMTNDGLYLCKANNPYKQLEDDCEERRPNWCPLIEIPEPHGRLGDLDALPWYLANTSVKYATYEDWEMLCDAIATAPTIIPASKEGEA